MAASGIYSSMIIFVVSFLRENSFINCGVKEGQTGKEKENDVEGNSAISEGLNRTPIARC